MLPRKKLIILIKKKKNSKAKYLSKFVVENNFESTYNLWMLTKYNLLELKLKLSGFRNFISSCGRQLSSRLSDFLKLGPLELPLHDRAKLLLRDQPHAGDQKAVRGPDELHSLLPDFLDRHGPLHAHLLEIAIEVSLLVGSALGVA